jgi:hypothetical protein
VAEAAPAVPAKPEPAMATAEAEDDNKPKKKGWWSLR